MKTQRFPQVAWTVLLGLVVSGVVWSTLALSQEQAPQMGACAQDAQKFCPDAKTPQERTQCLKGHEAELSPGCKELQARAANARARAQEKMAMLKKACKSEAETLCKDVKPGRDGSGMSQCLQAHEADLSTGCKASLQKGKGKIN